jgi:predicted nucleic acid-binding Zn ribbon protein
LGAATDLTKVRGILSKVLAFRGLDKKVERYEFILQWPEIVGEKMAEISKPDYIRNKVLFVQVLHPVWAQELTMMKPVLLQSLSRYLKPGDIVRDIVFRVGDADFVGR